VLIVILIMGVLVGVVGALMGGFAMNFEMADDHSIARRRAQDVFNILQIPVQNAGIGLPLISGDNNFGYCFGISSSTAAATFAGKVGDWPAPVSLGKSEPDAVSDDVLRVVYSMPSGVKVKGKIDDFSSLKEVNGESPSLASVKLTRPLSHDITGTFVTFPGIHMHPLFVESGGDEGSDEISLRGKLPYEKDDDEDVIPRNVIYPYHDMFLVRAGVAYVNNENSVFVFADDLMKMVGDPDAWLPTINFGANDPWFRIEGVKAIKFDYSESSVLTVRVLAEGDSADSARNDGTPLRNDLKARWEDHIEANGGAWDPAIYYEEFSMTWRTRNVARTIAP
jgi:hypothetical protein